MSESSFREHCHWPTMDTKWCGDRPVRTLVVHVSVAPTQCTVPPPTGERSDLFLAITRDHVLLLTRAPTLRCTQVTCFARQHRMPTGLGRFSGGPLHGCIVHPLQGALARVPASVSWLLPSGCAAETNAEGLGNADWRNVVQPCAHVGESKSRCLSSSQCDDKGR